VKAIRVHAYGAPDVLRHDDVEVPQPASGEALVQIAASGVNYLDVQFRTGRVKAPPFPFTLGMEGACVVAAVGPDVETVRVGDRVAYAMVLGACAECAVVPAARLVPVPDGVTLESAAAVLLQGMTAHYLTHSTFPLKAGDTALVHAGAGGLGLLVTQMARLLGATVIATVGTEAKAQIALEAGAHHTIVYTRDDFEAEVARLTSGRGVDAVYDSVGLDTFDKSLNCLRPRGGLALVGFSSGPVPPFDPAILGVKGSLFLTRPGLNQHIATREELLLRGGAVLRWLSTGSLTVRIDRLRPRIEAAAAYEALEARQTVGKTLLV
jgi:NADPH2:quinone reductase